MSGDGERFLPGQHALEAYGGGGFRFAGMSHRGSLLLLPSGVRAWPVTAAADLAFGHFAAAVAEAATIDVMVIGAGETLTPLDPALLAQLREAGLRVEVMATATAARTYNFLVSEGRRAAAALVAVP
ncbi:Mth938-like domain-containing protein [Camelimonas abortus]|uniref:Mth938-like domain-containing protein n=1 Tax=Camelimonas abortus TaxID=1017184 RepID=A0ABV7LFQ1_9HYPH